MYKYGNFQYKIAFLSFFYSDMIELIHTGYWLNIIFSQGENILDKYEKSRFLF